MDKLKSAVEDAMIATLYLNAEAFDEESESTLRRAWYWHEHRKGLLYLTDGYDKFARINNVYLKCGPKSKGWRATLLIEN